MKFLCSEKISAHKYKTPEGYLVCVDSVLARTGKQTYKRSEIFGCDCKDAENEVDVDRPAEEVFSDKTLASFENKPLTIEHPDEDVNTSNHRDLAVGFARDIKRGKDNGQDVMLGTLVFTDEDAIEAIENGEMVELSCGYDADIVDEDNPCQRNIRGNHIALCQRGRAGNARIVDSTKVKDDSLQKGKTYVTKSGATLKVVDYECAFRDYNGEAIVFITYEYVSASGNKTGRGRASSHDFWKMLTDKSLTGDSIKDDKLSDLRVVLRSISSMQRRDLDIEDVIRTLRNAGFKSSVENIDGWKNNTNVPGEQIKNYTLNIEDLNKRVLVTFYADMGKWKTKEINAYIIDSVKDNLELPEDEDSAFLYRDAYGKEIIVTNWDGNNVFFVEYDGTEQQMSKRDLEHYLDRKGARFSRVLRDSIKDAKWFDPEYDRYVTEDVIKKQYEKMKQSSAYFKQSYEKFREENFIEVKPGMERYYDAVKDAGLHQEQLAQQEYDKAEKRLNYLYEQRKKANLSGGSGMKFESEIAELEKKIAKLKKDFGYALGDSMKDADFSKHSKQGYQVIEMYRDGGRLHAILKRSNDYVIAYGYDTSDGTWAQGRYDFSTLERARQALQEEKKYAHRIADVDTYEEATKGLKKQANEVMNKRKNDSKEDILQKIRTTQIREGDTFEMRDGQYLVQIQNVGKQEMSTRSGPFKSNGKNESLRLSVKLSSYAWGRIWKNGTIVFNETDALNIVRDKMIQFLKTIRDSKGDK